MAVSTLIVDNSSGPSGSEAECESEAGFESM